MSVNRPLSITIIGWMLLASSVLSLGLLGYLMVSANLDQEQFVSVLIPFGFWSLCVMGLALGIFKGENWARILLLWPAPASITLSFVGGDAIPQTIIGTGLYIGLVFFLNRSAATDYFRKDRRKDRIAYVTVVILIALNVFVFFAPKIKQWAVETYRIGYVRNDIASLKLPADWKEVSSTRSVLNGLNAISQGGLAEIAWGGLSALEMPQIDIETGIKTTMSNKDAFVFQPGYLREGRAIFPCGLARYQLTFPDTTKDPLRQILNSQMRFSRGRVFKHQYLHEEDFQVVEYDVEIKGYRFFVWNWWKIQTPRKIYGIIMGASAKSLHQEDACGVANSAGSLELERADGRIWKATDINTRINPAMTQVSGTRIELDLNRLRMIRIDAARFFPWLKQHATGSALLSLDTLYNLSLPVTGNQKVRLADVARVQLIGRGAPKKNTPWHLLLVQLNYNCSAIKNDLEFIKQASASGLFISLNCR